MRNLDKPCADALYTWMCTIVFRPCLSLNYSGSSSRSSSSVANSRAASFAVPNLTCNSLCSNVNSICAATFLQYSQPPQIWYAREARVLLAALISSSVIRSSPITSQTTAEVFWSQLAQPAGRAMPLLVPHSVCDLTFKIQSDAVSCAVPSVQCCTDAEVRSIRDHGFLSFELRLADCAQSGTPSSRRSPSLATLR